MSKKKRRGSYKSKCHSKVVILPVCRKLDDKMSPGRLVAIAEWQEAK